MPEVFQAFNVSFVNEKINEQPNAYRHENVCNVLYSQLHILGTKNETK